MFHRFAAKASEMTGTAPAFLMAVAVVVIWVVVGVFTGFTDSHQLIINTATTIITFLMVFLIQHTQNVDTKAMQAKLDEIIRALPEASDALRGIEEEVNG